MRAHLLSLRRIYAYGFPDIYAAIEDYEELIIAVLKGGRRA